MILIEPKWNLKSDIPSIITANATILIEPKWNLKVRKILASTIDGGHIN